VNRAISRFADQRTLRPRKEDSLRSPRRERTATFTLFVAGKLAPRTCAYVERACASVLLWGRRRFESRVESSSGELVRNLADRPREGDVVRGV